MANQSQGISPIVAGIAGAAVGAAAVALSNKETRDQMGKTVKNLQDKGQKVYHDISNRSKELASKAQKTGEKLKEEGKQMQSEARSDLKHGA